MKEGENVEGIKIHANTSLVTYVYANANEIAFA